MKLAIRPLTLKQANSLVESLHRHHKPARGHRFSIALIDLDTGQVHGAAIVGRPVARGFDPYAVAEVTRLVTDGTANACSKLYGTCAKICQLMGYAKIQTYILHSESGTSLRATGWELEATTRGGDWNNSEKYRGKRRTDQPQESKKRYGRVL